MAKTATANFFDRERRLSNRPIWRETLAGMDWLALRSSPVYYGLGISRGDGASAAILIPGFMGTDVYLTELYLWLWRVGYKPYWSGVRWNAHCLEKLGREVIKSVERARAETNRPVHLIGHSLGGMIARSIAAQCGSEKIASVITLGSPFRGVSSHPLVRHLTEQVRLRILRENQHEHPECYTGHCGCPTISVARSPLPETILQTAVYTKTDGIVDWRMCVNDDASTNYEVSGTHVGLAFNPQVYKIVAERLYKSETISA